MGNLWKWLAEFFGVLTFIFAIKQFMNEAISTLKLPQQQDFYFLFFWGFVAALAGGLVWNLLNRFEAQRVLQGKIPILLKNQPDVGDTSEPHGREVVIWSIITNTPLLIVLVALNLQYQFIEIRQQIISYIFFLIGVTIGALIFYDLSLSGNIGIRAHFAAKNTHFLKKEFGLVIIWVALISSTGFLLMMLVKFGTAAASVDFSSIGGAFLKQIAICISLTTLGVTFFLLAFPETPMYGKARGIVAGLFLRIGLYLALILA